MLLSSFDAFADNTMMRIVFENPSETEEKTEPVKAYLPAELTKEDIIDTGGLKLDYDPATSHYFVLSDFVLKPKESRTVKVVVQDVWKIPEEELNFFKTQTEDRLSQMEGGADYENAKILHDKILAKINEIKVTQENQLGDVQNRIDSYRVNKERLRNIRSNVILIKDFKQESEIEADSIKYPKEIRFIVNIKNPSETEERKEEIVRYLPEGITPDNILDAQGFTIKFDVDKKSFYVLQKVELKPGETKKFVLKINDRWTVPPAKLNGFLEKATELNDFLAQTEFKATSEYLFNEINRYIQEILTSQAKVVTIKDRIAFYSENIKKVEAIKQDVLELERLAQIIRDRTKKSQIEELIKKLAPNEKTIWRIIYGTIVFLAVIAMATYALWWGQTRQKQVRKFDDISGGKKDKPV